MDPALHTAPPPPAVGALILAAGASSRMGSAKALLPVAGTTFLGRIVDVLAETPGVGPIRVVLGHEADRIRDASAALLARHPGRVSLVLNEAWRDGQLASLAAGLRDLESSAVTGALVSLVDHPLVAPSVVGRARRGLSSPGGAGDRGAHLQGSAWASRRVRPCALARTSATKRHRGPCRHRGACLRRS